MIALLLSAFLPLARGIEIAPAPIITPRRLELTREYCKRHYGLDSARLQDPQIIVIHATEMAEFKASLAAMRPDTLGPSRQELRGGGELNVGVHFLVDTDGRVYSLLPLDIIGRHAIGLNHVSIGVENVGFAGKLTPAQVEADAALVQDLLKRAPSLKYLIGHYEYNDKRLPHHALFKERDAGYKTTIKSDPGRAFMSALRKRLAEFDVALAK